LDIDIVCVFVDFFSCKMSEFTNLPTLEDINDIISHSTERTTFQTSNCIQIKTTISLTKANLSENDLHRLLKEVINTEEIQEVLCLARAAAVGWKCNCNAVINPMNATMFLSNLRYITCQITDVGLPKQIHQLAGLIHDRSYAESQRLEVDAHEAIFKELSIEETGEALSSLRVRTILAGAGMMGYAIKKSCQIIGGCVCRQLCLASAFLLYLLRVKLPATRTMILDKRIHELLPWFVSVCCGVKQLAHAFGANVNGLCWTVLFDKCVVSPKYNSGGILGIPVMDVMSKILGFSVCKIYEKKTTISVFENGARFTHLRIYAFWSGELSILTREGLEGGKYQLAAFSPGHVEQLPSMTILEILESCHDGSVENISLTNNVVLPKDVTSIEEINDGGYSNGISAAVIVVNQDCIAVTEVTQQNNLVTM
jgi:hypothetical protein